MINSRSSALQTSTGVSFCDFRDTAHRAGWFAAEPFPVPPVTGWSSELPLHAVVGVTSEAECSAAALVTTTHTRAFPDMHSVNLLDSCETGAENPVDGCSQASLSRSNLSNRGGQAFGSVECFFSAVTGESRSFPSTRPQIPSTGAGLCKLPTSRETLSQCPVLRPWRLCSRLSWGAEGRWPAMVYSIRHMSF